MSDESDEKTKIIELASSGVVSDLRAQLFKSTESAIPYDPTIKKQAKTLLAQANEKVEDIQKKKTERLQKTATVVAVGSAVANVIGALHSGLTGNVTSVVSHAFEIGRTASGYKHKQQKAVLEGQVLVSDHVKAMEILYERAFTKEQKDEFGRIVKECKGYKSLLEKIGEMNNPQNPQPLSIKAVEEFLENNANAKIKLERAVSDAINTDHNPERAAYRADFGALYSDPKAKTAVMARMLIENLGREDQKTVSITNPQQALTHKKAKEEPHKTDIPQR